MKINDIKTKEDVNIYLDYFSKLKNKENEIDEICQLMEGNNCNNFQALTLFIISDVEGDADTISLIDNSRKNLFNLTDYILDKYTCENLLRYPRYKMRKMSDREINLLDEINYQLDGYDELLKFFNEKIIN